MKQLFRYKNSEKPTGLFFYEQKTKAVIQAVQEFEMNVNLFSPEACRENAVKFSPERFEESQQYL